MSLLSAIAVLLLVAAVISLILSFLGILIVGALKLLPGVLLVMAIIFFARGGSVHIRFPDKRRK